MTMQSMLREKNMSMYRLSQISGVPKTTVIDICSGKSDIEGCTAKTVMQLSRALGCTMEELMQIDNARYEAIWRKVFQLTFRNLSRLCRRHGRLWIAAEKTCIGIFTGAS